MNKWYLFRCIVVGVILHLLMQICALLPYVGLGNSYQSIVFIILIALSAVVIVVTVLYKNKSTIVGLVRAITAFCTIAFLFILGGYSGVIISMHNLFGVSSNSSSDNVSGMLIVTYIFVLSLFCISALIYLAIVQLINHLRHLLKTGDNYPS